MPSDSIPNLQNTLFGQLQDKHLLQQAFSLASQYIDHIQHRQPFPTDEALDALRVFHEPMPPEPTSGDQVLKLLHTFGSPATVGHTAGRYFGFVTGGILPTTLAAKWLADAWDQSAALYLTSPITSELEAVCEGWLVDLLGLPAGTAAAFVTGTSTATMCGLAAGRNSLLKRMRWDVNADGLFGAPPLRVIISTQAHASVGKALGILGLGKSRTVPVPADSQGRMIPEQMPSLDESCLVLAQAGNVNSGSFDNFSAIARLARAAGAWLHIDGAFGLWAAASPNYRHLTEGIQLADSWSVDAHKTLNAPYDCGVILVKDRNALTNAVEATASYLPTTDRRDSMHLTLDMSRRSRAIELWAALKSLGRSGVQELLDQLCHHAAIMATGLASHGFRILNDVVFNQVLVACDTPAETTATLARLQQGGEAWCGGSSWKGEPVIRVSVCSWATTQADINRSIAAFVTARATQ